jgi:hypothetical protein
VKLKERPSLSADARRLYRTMLKWGALLAVLCHLLPPHYRAACNALASICGAGGH